MPNLLRTVKSFGLTEFYFSLSFGDKTNLANYSQYLTCLPQKKMSCAPNCDGCFMVSNGAQFLWATAANAMPDKKLLFAERLLTHALTIAREKEDIAWIHANLAQVYYEGHKTGSRVDSRAASRSISHCRKLIELGYMKSWAQNMMEEMLVCLV